MCREASTECDLPEFCSGNSEFCPEDFTKADGTPCSKGLGYCYEAQCGSHEGMCQTVWGHTATVAEDACFSKLNVRGGSSGNCGFKRHSKTELLPCDERDILCGSLQCLTVPGSKPQLNKAMSFATFPFSYYRCSYVVSSDRLAPYYWLTPNGAKCGNGKMCVNQKCLEIPEPSGYCRGGCSGHGVCNTRNHCHCDPGYAPPDCSKKGVGGSIDSNRTGRDQYKDPLWEVIFILALIILGGAIAICCLWSHVHRWWEERGRANTQPCCARCLDACCCPLMSFITDHLWTSKRNESVSKEVQEEWEQDKMICQVDLDLKDNESHTNSWGVANERLVTEVVTMTPKISPDFRRKIQLPSHHSAHQAKTPETVHRPTYLQSVSVDSGCVSDVEETTVKEPLNASMSMSSLVSVFKNFGTRSSPSVKKKETSPARTFERQRSVPLRRFVIDPLAGSRRSRHGTPPPDHVKQEWRRSVSLDAQSTATGRSGGASPPLPPATKKPYKNKDKSHKVKSQEDVRPQVKGQGVRCPGSNPSPPPPPVNQSPVLSSSLRPTPPPQTRKPMMPPVKTQTSVNIKTQSKSEFSTNIASAQQKNRSPQNPTPKGPLLPPVRGSKKSTDTMLPKASVGSSSKQQTVPPPSTTAGRVKDLAKKLEKQ